MELKLNDNQRAQVELILDCANMSLEDYCKEVAKFYPLTSTISFTLSANSSQALLYERMNEMAKLGVLPELSGFIGFESLSEAEEYEHEYFIERHSHDDETKELYGCGPGEDGFDNYSVRISSVNVVSAFQKRVSAFQDSELLVASTELPGNYYILDHDGDETVLTGSHDNFIKAMCSLVLMKDIDVFFAVLPKLPNAQAFDLKDPLETLARIVLGGDDVVKSIDGFNFDNDHHDKLYDFYWEVREGVS